MEWDLGVGRESENALDWRIGFRIGILQEYKRIAALSPFLSEMHISLRIGRNLDVVSIPLPSFLHSFTPRFTRTAEPTSHFPFSFYRSFTLSFYMILSKLPE